MVENNKKKQEWFILIIVILLLYTVMEMLGVTCPIKYVTGISCAGCGMSRAMLSVMRLDFAKAFYYHPGFLLPPIFVVTWLLKDKMNKKVYQTICTICLVVFILIYLYRMIFMHGDIVVFRPDNNLMFRIIRYIKTNL